MGGAVSAGSSNDDLVDNLKQANYIKSRRVESVFRAVDRADYYLSDHKDAAYKDLAWKCGHLHLSAPCIYSEVMENLELAPGLSFLNIGSGTGYLSTMAGLILGPHGVNHGVEIYPDVVKYAEEKFDAFRRTSPSFDDFDCPMPRFVCGNGLRLEAADGQMPLYDRVYCGAAVPPDRENFMKNLLKVNGMLVMPLGDQLMKVRRISETEWESNSILPVSFASLQVPNDEQKMAPAVILPNVDPLSLQELCRAVIRPRIRERVQEDFPQLKKKKKMWSKKKLKKKLAKASSNRGCLSLGGPSLSSRSGGSGGAASSSNHHHHNAHLRFGGGGRLDDNEGNLFALAPRALVNFVMFSQNAPYPAYADGFESPAGEGEEEEEEAQEAVASGEVVGEEDEEEGEFRREEASMDASPSAADAENDNIEINNNSDDNNNSALDLNNEAAPYRPLESRAEEEEASAEEAGPLLSQRQHGRQRQSQQQQQRQKKSLTPPMEGIRFCVTPPPDAASVECVNDDDIVIGGDIRVDERALLDGKVEEEEEEEEEEEPTIVVASPSRVEERPSSSTSPLKAAATSAARPIRYPPRLQNSAVAAVASTATAVAEKDGDFFTPSSFDSGIGEGTRGSYSSLGSTPGSSNSPVIGLLPHPRSSSRRTRNSSSRLSETSDLGVSIFEEDELANWDFEEGSMDLTPPSHKSNEVATIVRCSAANGEKVITIGPSPIAEETDAFLTFQDEKRFRSADPNSSTAACMSVTPLCGTSCGGNEASTAEGAAEKKAFRFSLFDDQLSRVREEDAEEAMDSSSDDRVDAAAKPIVAPSAATASPLSIIVDEETKEDDSVFQSPKGQKTAAKAAAAATAAKNASSTTGASASEAVSADASKENGNPAMDDTNTRVENVNSGRKYNPDDDFDDNFSDDEDVVYYNTHFAPFKSKLEDKKNRPCAGARPKRAARNRNIDDDDDDQNNDVDEKDDDDDDDNSSDVSSSSSGRMSPLPSTSAEPLVVNHFRDYIQKLPLPAPLHAFLLYHRDI